jgi:hypothetical protein
MYELGIRVSKIGFDADIDIPFRFGRPAGEKSVVLILRKNRPVQQI